MDYQYSPFNPVIWGIFIGGVALIYVIVRAFRARHPDYPSEVLAQKRAPQADTMEEDSIDPHTSTTAFAAAGGGEERRRS